MPKVVTFSVFLPLSISSCVVWANALLQQKHKRVASIFFIRFLLGENRAGSRAAIASFFAAWILAWRI